MYSYPLKFKVSDNPTDDKLRVIDADKNEILFRYKINPDIEEGNAPCVVYTDEVQKQPLYHILFPKPDTEEDIVITTPGRNKLGTIRLESNGRWIILDEHENLVANVIEKRAWKNSCLFTLLTVTLIEDLQKLILPHRFDVMVKDQRVLVLRQTDSTLNTDYKLNKKGDFLEKEETLMVLGLIKILGS